MNTRDADLVPAADGENFTLTVQEFVGVTVWPLQVSAVLVKSLEFVPLMATDETVTFPPPVLVKVAVNAVLVNPTVIFPKLKLAGSSTAGAAVAALIATIKTMAQAAVFAVQLAVCWVLAATPEGTPSSAED